MVSQEKIEEFKRIIKEFFKKTTFDLEIHFSTPEENSLSVDVKTDQPQILIGERGQTLADIQRLLKIILRRQTQEVFYINVDVNDYKKKKIEYLKELARSTADEVTLSKREKVLTPMRAFERRIIHMELADRSDIVTESTGTEPDRKVIVKLSS